VNLFAAIAERDAERFLLILDEGVKLATKRASQDSHALGLRVTDGRSGERQPHEVEDKG
jgi:hypothetical protein